MGHTVNVDALEDLSILARLFVWLDGLVGAWLMGSVLILPGPGIESLDDVVVGALLVGIAAFNWHRLRRGRGISLDSATVGALAGLWLVAFSIDFNAGTVLVVENVVAGAIVLLGNALSYRAARDVRY